MKKGHQILVAFLLVACILLGSCKSEKPPIKTPNGGGNTPTVTQSTTLEITVGTYPEQISPEATTPQETTPEQTTPIQTTPEETTTIITTPVPAEVTTPSDPEDTAYLNIPIKKPRGYMTREYGLKNSSFYLKLKFYLDWERLDEDDGACSIWSEGKEIGRIVAGDAPDADEWRTVYRKESAPAALHVTEYLERCGTGETLRFRHRFCYRYMECGEERRITLTLDYGEADTYVQNQLRDSAFFMEHHTDPMYGALSHLQDKPLLVLGNSFIPYSNIVYIYNDIAKNSGKSQVMSGQSRGYVGTYARDTELLNRIAKGEWGAVLICGFYNVVTDELGVIKAACDQSGTELIIFPAHNESDLMIASAQGAYPDLICINWKREIDCLIKEGRSRWDFCVDDEHMHSTPLAGYVAAMMIWRAIWGEMPTGVTLTSGAVDQAHAATVLGAYLESPTFALVDTSNITFLE